MNARTKFLKMYYKLPENARRELVLNAYETFPCTLNVIALEVRGKTKLGDDLLIKLGFVDDKPVKRKKFEFGGGY